MFVTSNVYLNIMFLHIACGFELLHNPFNQTRNYHFCKFIVLHPVPVKSHCTIYMHTHGQIRHQVKETSKLYTMLQQQELRVYACIGHLYTTQC